MLKDSGCDYLHFGLESGSSKVLRLMNKTYEKNLAAKVLKETFKSNINFNFNIIVGFPGETTIDFIKTLLFIRKFLYCNIAPSVAICNIPINSALYKHPKKYGINFINNTWYVNNPINTKVIRQLRYKYVLGLYNSKILNSNLNKLPHKKIDYFAGFKYDYPKTIFILTKIIKGTGVIINSVFYLFFLVWIIYLSILLSIIGKYERIGLYLYSKRKKTGKYSQFEIKKMEEEFIMAFETKINSLNHQLEPAKIISNEDIVNKLKELLNILQTKKGYTELVIQSKQQIEMLSDEKFLAIINELKESEIKDFITKYFKHLY